MDVVIQDIKAGKGDVLVLTMPDRVDHEWFEQARHDLQEYLEPRGIGLVMVANGIKADVCSNANGNA